MRSCFSATIALLVCVLAGCDQVKEIEEKFNSDEKGQSDAKDDSNDNEVASGSAEPTSERAEGNYAGPSTTSGKTNSRDAADNKPKRSAPQFPDLAAEQRPAAEALARSRAKFKIEGGVVTELSMRGASVQEHHMPHIFKLTSLKKLDLASNQLTPDMLEGISVLRELEFVDLTSNTSLGTETFVELLEIPTMHFMVLDNTSIRPDAFDALVRDRRMLILSLRGMSEVFTDDLVMEAFNATRRRVTFATNSGVLPAGKSITYPLVAGVQTSRKTSAFDY